MPKTKVYNLKAEVVGDITLSDEVFGQEYNEALIHQAVVAYNNNQRQGTKSTLTRSEVRGHAKKPWAQKHTGRARHGSTKGPQWEGGGVVFAPKPRDFSQKMNKIAKNNAFKSALSAKLAEKNLVVLDELKVKQPKTKEFAKIVDAFKQDKRALFVTTEPDENILRASNNIPNIGVTYAAVLNTYDLVSNGKVYITKDAVKKIEEANK